MDHGWFCDKRFDRRFVCFPFVLAGGYTVASSTVFKFHFRDSPFSSKCDLKFSIFSLNISLQEFVPRAFPLRGETLNYRFGAVAKEWLKTVF